jgi:citrate synthase
MRDPEQKIARPRQVYTGSDERHLPAEKPVISVKATL